MDFLLSFRFFGSSKEAEAINEITGTTQNLRRTALVNFLLLSVNNVVWCSFQIAGVVIRFLITTYSITFLHEGEGWFLQDYFTTALDLFFVVDIISAILYRSKWPNNKRIMRESSPQLSKLVWRNVVYNPRPIWMLVVDTFSVIPFQLLKHWVDLYSSWSRIILCAPALRIYKLFVFYKLISVLKGPKTQSVIAVSCKFCMFWMLLTHSITCFWHLYTLYTNSEIIDTIKQTKSFSYNKPFSWYWMFFYFVQITITNTGFGDITPTTDVERVFVAVFCFIGFILLNGFLIAVLTTTLEEQTRRVTILRFRIYLMEDELEQRKVPKTVVAKVIKFYQSLWNSRRGVGPSNEMLTSLPESLWGQVYFDIFGPALNASLLFRSCDEIVKRAIAKVMQIDLFMAGDVILKRNDINSKMFYIRKGTVQIMSFQDDETEIMTFGSGSVFGQVAVLLSLPARSEVHAATFCEIHLINRKPLFAVLKDYPDASVKIRRVHTNILMNVLADKFKFRSQKTPPPPQNVLTESAFYKVPQQASKLARGDICVVNTCPYVFEPDTVYLNSWSVFLAVIILTISVYYPYCAVFTREYPQNAEPFIILVDILLLLNLYFSFATAYVKENVLFSSPRDIVVTKLTKPYVYIDVISLLPLHYCIDQNQREKPVMLCLRCLQFYKLHFLFSKAEYSVNMKMVDILRLIKYVLYFFYGGYVMGMVYYAEACYYEPCTNDSWYEKVKNTTDSPIWMSLYFAILVMSGTGYGDVTANNERDVGFAIACCFGGVFLFIYLIAEYSANLSLSRKNRQNFMELVGLIRSFLTRNKVLPSEKIRTRQYLNLQWEKNKGYEFTSNNSLFYDTPQHLLTEISQYTRSRVLQNLKLFKGISEGTLRQILTHCSRDILPPHEVVIYAGDICDSLIVIEEGYCELTYGNDISQKKILTGGDEIATVELFLGMTSLCHVRTITHCSILKVHKDLLFRALLRNFLAIKEFQESIAEFEQNPIVKKIKEKPMVRLHLVVQPPPKKSVFRFVFLHKQKADLQLKEPFMRLGLCQWIRFLIGRLTLLPYGKVLKLWELSRCLFAFLSAMIFPLLPYFQCQFKSFYYVGVLLDITAWIDLYFRLHVCYYNKKKLLVSHPLYTAVHYIKGSFIMDFIFCFPFDRIMFRPVYDAAGYTYVTNGSINLLRLLRVGQVYRIPTTVLHLGKDFLSAPSLFRVMVMMSALTLVFLNFLTSVVVLLCVNYKSTEDGQYEIDIKPRLRTHINQIQEMLGFTKEPIILYLMNFYWICETSFGLGFGDITAGCTELKIYVIIIIVFSYLYFNYTTIIVASHLSSINVNLTIFQKRMFQLITYLKSENVEQMLIKHIINHFEHLWKTDKGMKAQVVFANFNTTLKNDIMVYLYEEPLKRVPAFANLEQSFFRLLSKDLKEMIFKAGAGIYKEGEIITNLYIVQQGEVTLVGKDENDTVVLGPSKIFGHMDNTPRGMVTNSAVATKNVSILVIKTARLYKLLRNIKGFERNAREEFKFRQALENSNTSDSDSLQTKSFKAAAKESSFSHWTYQLSTYIVMGYAILSLFSVNEVMYTLAFQYYSTGLICVVVPVELLFLLKIFIGFTKGYVDETGEFISSYRLIAARYMRLNGFYLDLFTVIPFEIFAAAFPKHNRKIAFSWFRITKVLRIFHISEFFSMKLDTLSVNMLLFKIVAVAVWTGTLLHCCTCIWFLISCYRAYCPDTKTWQLILQGDFEDLYVSALYFIVVVITTTGFGDAVPKTLLEIVVTEFFMFIAFFYTAIFIGQIISTAQKTLYAKTNYTFEVEGMKTFLHVNDVPIETQKMIFRYVRNLWHNEKGSQIPILLTTAHPYLIHEVKYVNYGHHINQNPVFKVCSQFFKRQLSFELKRTVYFSGDVIVYEGEVNRTVYFVHSGLVEGRSSDSTRSPKAYEMNTFFGLKQGVSPREPHKMTYTAHTYCAILSLELNRWSFLSEFFPDDIKHIHREIEEREWD